MPAESCEGHFAQHRTKWVGSAGLECWLPTVQAAEQGDADKVGKKRKKSKGKASEEELFGEERAPADRAAALREAGTAPHSTATIRQETERTSILKAQNVPAVLREAGTPHHRTTTIGKQCASP